MTSVMPPMQQNECGLRPLRDIVRASLAWDNGTVNIMSTDSVPESQPAPETPDAAGESTAAPAAQPAAPVAPSAAHVRSTSDPAAAAPTQAPAEPQEDFADLLFQFQRSHTPHTPSG